MEHSDNADSLLTPSYLDEESSRPMLQLPSSGATFARHDTFHPRFGWLKKGFEAACKNPEVFTQDDAPVELGVGKNMVRAIRYWCHAFGLLDEKLSPRARLYRSVPSAFGRWLIGSGQDEGVDPYLEDLGSLWLLHWELLRENGIATAWHFAFFHFASSDFTADELKGRLEGYVAREYPRARTAPSSLRKDAACLVRMYGELPSGTTVSEESIHCPFAELRLLRPGAMRRTYSFQSGPKPGLTSELVASACLSFAARRAATARTMSIATLLRDVGSPGLAFRLSEGALYMALEAATRIEPGLEIADAGGIVQLSFMDPPAVHARRLADQHYIRAMATK